MEQTAMTPDRECDVNLATQAYHDGWLRAIDEELVLTHVGVANPNDSYEDAKKKLHTAIEFHVQVATDPAVNGGYILVPAQPCAKADELKCK